MNALARHSDAARRDDQESTCEIIPIAPFVHIEEHLGQAQEVGSVPSRVRGVAQRIRLIWGELRAAEQRFSESIWGDALAGICAVLIAVALPFIVWGIQ